MCVYYIGEWGCVCTPKGSLSHLDPIVSAVGGGEIESNS